MGKNKKNKQNKSKHKPCCDECQERESRRSTNPFLNVPGERRPWIVPPPNPPGFGIERPELRYETPLVTGQVLFDDLFHTVLPMPPLQQADPCYKAWVLMFQAAANRLEKCPPGQESPVCTAAREAYFEMSRRYASCLDIKWGLQRFDPQGREIVKEGAPHEEELDGTEDEPSIPPVPLPLPKERKRRSKRG